MKHYLFTAATGVKTCNQVISIRAALMTVRYIEIKLSLDADVHGYYPDFKMEIKHDGGNITILAFSNGSNTYEFIDHCMWFASCRVRYQELLIPKLEARNSRLCNHKGKRSRYIYYRY